MVFQYHLCGFPNPHQDQKFRIDNAMKYLHYIMMKSYSEFAKDGTRHDHQKFKKMIDELIMAHKVKKGIEQAETIKKNSGIFGMFG